MTTGLRRSTLTLVALAAIACAPASEPAEDTQSVDDEATEDDVADTEPSPDDGDGSSGAAFDPCAVGPDQGLEIGHGLDGFVPFPDAEAELVYGPQGGFHITIGVHAWGLDSSDVAVARLRGIVGGEALGFSAPYADLVCTNDGQFQEALLLPLIWDGTPDMLHMQTATVEVELTDAAGNVVTATGETSIIDPMQN